MISLDGLTKRTIEVLDHAVRSAINRGGVGAAAVRDGGTVGG